MVLMILWFYNAGNQLSSRDLGQKSPKPKLSKDMHSEFSRCFQVGLR